MERERKGNKDLISAFQTTIDDLEIQLRNCEWYQFKYAKKLRKDIEYFESKISALK